MPKVENAEWEPQAAMRGGRRLSESVAAVRALKVGECKRIFHDDVRCTVGEKIGQGCAISQAVSRLRDKGWKFDSYHEKQYVLVIRRLK